MIARVVIAAALLILLIIIAAAARALILAATRHGRHAWRDGYEAGCDDEADSFVAELRGLPAPGETIYTDRNVWLPRTPQAGDLSPFTPGPVVWTPSRSPVTEAELAEFKERFLAAQGKPPIILPPADEDDLYDLCGGCRGREHCDGAVEFCCCTCGWGEDWDEEDENEEPDPFLSETPEQVLPAWVIEALNGHDGVDACVDSIVARTEATGA